MKTIFLDIDGVLNNDYTKEEFYYGETAFTGVSQRLRDMFLSWMEGKDYKIVLTSTWRQVERARQELLDNGIHWKYETPYLPGEIRGEEIQQILDQGFITKYVILDDLGAGNFLKDQRPFLIQTSPKHGLRQKNLEKADKLLV